MWGFMMGIETSPDPGLFSGLSASSGSLQPFQFVADALSVFPPDDPPDPGHQNDIHPRLSQRGQEFLLERPAEQRDVVFKVPGGNGGLEKISSFHKAM